MGYSYISVTDHALERWWRRVRPGDSVEHVRRVVARSRRVPRELRPYFQVSGDMSLRWDYPTKVLFVMSAHKVVTCYRARGGHRVLLERFMGPLGLP